MSRVHTALGRVLVNLVQVAVQVAVTLLLAQLVGQVDLAGMPLVGALGHTVCVYVHAMSARTHTHTCRQADNNNAANRVQTGSDSRSANCVLQRIRIYQWLAAFVTNITCPWCDAGCEQSLHQGTLPINPLRAVQGCCCRLPAGGF